MAKFIKGLIDILNVCDVRSSSGLSCKDCIYYGKKCTEVKTTLNVQKPYMHIDELEYRRYKNEKN